MFFSDLGTTDLLWEHLIRLLRRQLIPVAAASRFGYKYATGIFA